LVDLDAAGLLTATSVTTNASGIIDLDTSSGGIIATSVGSADTASITAASGDITLGSVTAVNAVDITATLGSINDATTDATTADVVGSSVTLTAGSGIGNSNVIELADGAVVDLSVNVAGNLAATGLGVLTVSSADTTAGNITLDATTLSISGPLASGGGLVLSGSSVLNVNAAVNSAGGVLLQNTGTANIGANISAGTSLSGLNVSSVALNNASLTTTAGSIDLSSGVGSISVAGAAVTMTAGGAGDILLAPVSDAADALITNLLLNSGGSVTLAGINLDDGITDGNFEINIDQSATPSSIATLTIDGALGGLASLTIAGDAANNDLIFVNASVSSSGAVNVSQIDRMEIASGNNITGSAINFDASVDRIQINGTDTTRITSTGGSINLADVVASSSTLELQAGPANTITVGGFTGGANLRVVDSLTTEFTGAVTAGSVILSDTSNTVSFLNTTSIDLLSTSNNTYGIRFLGDSTTIDSNVSFANSGSGNGGVSLVLGSALSDTVTFNSGATANAGSLQLFGALQSANSILSVGDIEVLGNSRIDTTVASSMPGAALNLGAITGVGNPSLSIDSGVGLTTIAGSVDGLSSLTVINSGGVTFQDTVGQSGSFDFVVGTTTANETIAFQNNTTFNSITANSNDAYSLSFTGSSTVVDQFVDFTNSGGLVLGNGASDSLLFRNGLTYSGVGTVNMFGALRTNAGAVDLGGNITLGNGTSVIDTTNNNVAATGSNIQLGAVNGNASTLRLNAGDSSNQVIFSGNSQLQSLVTDARNFGVTFLGNSNRVNTGVSFLNTGGLTLGDATSDSTEFVGGMSAVSSTTLAGTLNSAGQNVTLQSLTVASGTTATLNTAGGTLAVLGNIQGIGGGASETLTVIAGTGDVTLGAIAGIDTSLNQVLVSSANNLTFNSVNLAGSLIQTSGTGTTLFSDTVTVGQANLTTSGVDIRGSFAAAAGLSVTGDVSLGANLTTTNADIFISGSLSLKNSSDIALTTTGGDIQVDGVTQGSDGTGSESLTLSAGTGAVALGGLYGANLAGNASGLSTVNIASASAVVLDVVELVGNLAVIADNAISQRLNTLVSVDGFVNLTAEDIVLTQLAATGVVTVAAIDDVSLTSTIDLLLNGSVGGDLLVSAEGSAISSTALSTSGSSIYAADSLSLMGLSAAGDIQLAIADGATLVNDQATAVKGNATTLSVTANTGTVTDSSDLVVQGSASFAASGVGGGIVLNNTGNAFGTVSLVSTTGAVLLVEADDTMIGNLAANSVNITSGGMIEDAVGAVLTVAGQSIFKAVGTVTLGDDSAGEVQFGSVDLTGTAVALTEQGGTLIDGIRASSLVLSSGGVAITNSASASISVMGSVSIDAGTAAVTLGSDGGLFEAGSLNVSAGAVSVREASSTLLGNIAVDSFDLVSSGAITETAGSVIRVTGSADLKANSGNSAIDLQLGNNQFGELSLLATSADLVMSSAAQLGSIVASRLTLAAAGDITGAGVMSVDTLRLNASNGTGIVTLNNQDNDLSVVSVKGSAASIVNIGVTRLEEIQLTSLQLQSAGDITDIAGLPVFVTGAATLLSAGDISLGALPNDSLQLGSFLASGRKIDITQTGDVLIAGLTAATSASVMSTAGDIGVVTGAVVTVGDAASFSVDSATGNIDLSISVNTLGNVALTGRTVSLTESDNISLRSVIADTLILQTGGDVTNLDGASIAVSGTSQLTANAIALGTQASDTANFGRLNITAVNASISESSSMLLGTISATNLTLQAVDAITDAANAIVNVSGKADLTVLGNASSIVLDGAANSLARLSAKAGEVSINANADLVVDSIVASGTNGLNLTVAGKITVEELSGEIIVDQQANINAGSVLFDVGSNNKFGGLDLTITDTNIETGFVEIRANIEQSTFNGNPTKSDGNILIKSPRIILGAEGGTVAIVTQGADGGNGSVTLGGVLADGSLAIEAGELLINGDVTIDTTNDAVSAGSFIAAAANADSGVRGRGLIQSENPNAVVTLALNSGSANTTLGNFVEGQEINALIISGANDIDLGDVFVAGNTVNIVASGEIVVTGAVKDRVGSVFFSAGDGIRFDKSVEAAESLGVDTIRGDVTFNGDVMAGENVDVTAGGAVASKNITVEQRLSLGAGTSMLLGGSVTAGTAVLVATDDITFENVTVNSDDTIFRTTAGDVAIASIEGRVNQNARHTITADGKLSVSAQTGMAIASMNAGDNITLALLGSLDGNGNAPAFSRVDELRTLSTDASARRDVVSGGTIAYLALTGADVGTAEDSFSQRATKGIFYGLQSGQFFSVDVGVSEQLSSLVNTTIESDFINLFSSPAGLSGAAAPGTVFNVNSIDLGITNTVLAGSSGAGETPVASNSRSTAAAQRDDEDELAEVNEVAFQDLKSYDENPQGMMLPEDQQFTYDPQGNIYFMVTLRGDYPYGTDKRVPLYRVNLSLDTPPLVSAAFEGTTDYSPSLVQFGAVQHNSLAGGE
jgi:hypothetical protein